MPNIFVSRISFQHMPNYLKIITDHHFGNHMPNVCPIFYFTHIYPIHAQYDKNYVKNHHQSSFCQSYAQHRPNISFHAHIPNTCPIRNKKIIVDNTTLASICPTYTHIVIKCHYTHIITFVQTYTQHMPNTY